MNSYKKPSLFLIFISSLLRCGKATAKCIVSPFVLFKYRNIRKKNRQEIEQRKILSIFDAQRLAKPLPYAAAHITHGMNLYGFFSTFTQYAGLKKINPRHGIEHGLYIAAKGKQYAHEITFGDYRERALTIAHSKAVKIGPYIHYATPLLNEDEFNVLKQQVGKVLLVFPMHSIDALTVAYDIAVFIEYIEKKKAPYDTVIVCLHWKDFELNKATAYEAKSYKIVTAGHPYDDYFLPRLKTIINLSDMVVSNDVGTHVGYCIYMNKPVNLFTQSVQYKSGSSENAFKKEINTRTSEEWDELRKIKERLHRLFSIFDEKITKEQYDEIAGLFGFNCIRDRKTLKKMLK